MCLQIEDDTAAHNRFLHINRDSVLRSTGRGVTSEHIITSNIYNRVCNTRLKSGLCNFKYVDNVHDTEVGTILYFIYKDIYDFMGYF